jgi:hypothetical protein
LFVLTSSNSTFSNLANTFLILSGVLGSSALILDIASLPFDLMYALISVESSVSIKSANISSNDLWFLSIVL